MKEKKNPAYAARLVKFFFFSPVTVEIVQHLGLLTLGGHIPVLPAVALN
jgi:hypothetical protein